jgi:hypothetical protein
MICPCACAAMQRIGMDTNKVDNVHPFYHIWYHPLWKEAIKSLQLSNYKDSPYYSLTNLKPTSNAAAQDPSSNITLEDTMQHFNSEIFDKIGHLGNISESQRINKMREHFNKLEKFAVKSVQSTKYAICSIIEVTNRLDLYLFLLLAPTSKLVLLIGHYIAIRNIHSKIYLLSSI